MGPRLRGDDRGEGGGVRMLTRCLSAVAAVLIASPASVQFYNDTTLTLLLNPAARGHDDTAARLFPRQPDRHNPAQRTSSLTNHTHPDAPTTDNQHTHI